jgi:hypothetical protein
VGALIESALSDSSISVRREAVGGLTLQPPDPRAAAALRAIMARESDVKLLWLARHALKRHDPDYRREMIEQAKAKSRLRSDTESTETRRDTEFRQSFLG